MTIRFTGRPLVRWDRTVLRFDLDALELVVNQQLEARHSPVSHLTFLGADDEVFLRGRVVLRGVPTTLTAHIGEMRLYRQFFGCRVLGLSGPLGVPLPLGLLESLLRRSTSSRIHFETADGILTVDLRDALPSGLELTVNDVRCVRRDLILTLAFGSWTPTVRDLLLPATNALDEEI